jgi:DNA-binding CsgD family transcriptional regulator/tetratricopeptide (TPR) repeat protein
MVFVGFLLQRGALSALIAQSSAELLQRGEIDACLRRTAGASSAPDLLIRAQAFIRKGEYREALDTLAAVSAEIPDEHALCLALKSECHSRRGELDLARDALVAIFSREYCPDVCVRIALSRMLVAWVEGNPQRMAAALQDVEGVTSPPLRARVLHARAWRAAALGEYAEQLRLLRAAAELFLESPDARDEWLLASSMRSLIHLVREVAVDDETFAFAVDVVQSIRWTQDLQSERFLTYRGLAWAYALRGAHADAYRYMYRARDIAPSEKWITACYADLAYLATMAGDARSADAVLDHAVACARDTDWTSDGEERVVLLNLVELVGDRDAAAGRHFLDLYERIAVDVSPALSLAHGNRLIAMEAYANGVVLHAAGQSDLAVERFQEAYEAFAPAGYGWRAAAAALRLHGLTRLDRWLDAAVESVAGFPSSSVAGEIRKLKARTAVDPRLAALTPAQRRVFALVCEGLSDKDVAAKLDISPETAKNHVARVRAAFGVRSRAALIAGTRHLAAVI